MAHSNPPRRADRIIPDEINQAQRDRERLARDLMSLTAGGAGSGAGLGLEGLLGGGLMGVGGNTTATAATGTGAAGTQARQRRSVPERTGSSSASPAQSTGTASLPEPPTTQPITRPTASRSQSLSNSPAGSQPSSPSITRSALGLGGVGTFFNQMTGLQSGTELRDGLSGTGGQQESNQIGSGTGAIPTEENVQECVLSWLSSQ